jgi:hypothetical protein
MVAISEKHRRFSDEPATSPDPEIEPTKATILRSIIAFHKGIVALPRVCETDYTDTYILQMKENYLQCMKNLFYNLEKLAQGKLH